MVSNLIPFSKQYLQLNQALPFGLRDASGHLLLAAGARIDRAERLAELQAADLYADEVESTEWRRRLALKMDEMIRANESLGRIVNARPDAERERAVSRKLNFGEQWTDIWSTLDGVLRDLGPQAAWQPRLGAVRARAHEVLDRRADASLYHLIFSGGHSTEHYSSRHALLCLAIVREAALLLEWHEDLVTRLELAVLTMNVSMRKLQDMLAAHSPVMTPAMRAQIDSHAQRSAEMLAEAGVTDAQWLQIVRLHHDDSRAALPLAALDDAERAARLIRRVDVFAAKLSRRATRVPMSPVQAAREACLGSGGVPDEIGSALLKAVGLFPPGSFVELANGEVAIVLARGRRANLPIVAALVAPSGTPLGVPALRDTTDRRYAVKGAVKPASVKVLPPHELLLAMR